MSACWCVVNTAGFKTLSKGKLKIAVFWKQLGFLKDYLFNVLSIYNFFRKFFQNCQQHINKPWYPRSVTHVCAWACIQHHTQTYGERGFLEPNVSGLLPMAAFSNVNAEACVLRDMGKTSGVSTYVGNVGSHNAKQASSQRLQCAVIVNILGSTQCPSKPPDSESSHPWLRSDLQTTNVDLR